MKVEILKKYIVEEGTKHDGIYTKYQFPNGYGASVVKNSVSYGGKSGLYELAVLDGNSDLTYDTPITDDVLGYLTLLDVTKHLKEVKNLEPKLVSQQEEKWLQV